jgi:hypothetical protein
MAKRSALFVLGAALLASCGNPPPEKIAGKWQHVSEPWIMTFEPEQKGKKDSGLVTLEDTKRQVKLVGTYGFRTGGRFVIDMVNANTVGVRGSWSNLDISFDDKKLVLNEPRGGREEFRRLGN